MGSRTKQSVFACVALALISRASSEPIPSVPSGTASTTTPGNDTDADGNAWDPSTDDIYFVWDDLTDPYGQYGTYTLNITGDYLANANESSGEDFGFGPGDPPPPEPEEIQYVSNITTVSYDDIVAQSAVLKQELDFSAAGTLAWLENWIQTNMSDVDYTSQEFISAFLDSIRPIWNGADPDRRLNFRCTIDSPCNAGLTPPSLDPDVRYAWRVLIAMQNMNTFWSLQVDLWLSVSVWFGSQFDAIWNRLSRDGSTMSYPGLLPSGVSAGKNLIKVLGTLNAALRTQLDFVAPYLGLVIDLIRIVNPTPELPPLIPNADIQAHFADYIDSQTRTARRSFDRIMSSDPFDPTTGFYSVLLASPQAYLPDDQNALTYSVADQAFVTASEQLRRNMGAALVNMWYSMTGQHFGTIIDRRWNTPASCSGRDGFSYPVCLVSNFPGLTGWRQAFGMAAGTRTGLGIRNVENPAFRILDDNYFTNPRGHWRWNARQVLEGSLQCQSTRMRNNQFNNQNRLLDLFLPINSLSALGAQDSTTRFVRNAAHAAAADREDGVVLYESSMDDEDPCFWAVPVVFGLYDIGFRGSAIRARDQLILASQTMQQYIRSFRRTV